MSISFSPPKSGCAADDSLCHLNYETRHRRHAVALLDGRPFSMLSCKLSDYSLNVQHKPKMVQIGRRSNPAETVTQLVYEVPAGLKPALLIHLLGDLSFDSVLVFTRTKHGADRIAKRLTGAQITTATLHSNRSQQLQIRRTDPNWSPSQEQNHCEILGAVGPQDQNSLDVAGSTRSRDERDKTRVVFTVPCRE